MNKLLGGRSSGIFKNSKNEYCTVLTYYVKNTKYFQIIFSKTLNDIAYRNAIKTTSEKKILKVLNENDFELEIPPTGKKIKLRMMLVKEEKILLMAKQSGLSQQVMAIKQVVQNCVLDDTDISKLPTFDVEYLFIKIRARSINNIVNLLVTDAEDGKKYEVESDLDEVQVSFEGCTSPKIEINDNFGLLLKYPNFDDLDDIMKMKDGGDKASKILVRSVDKIYSGDSVVIVADHDENEVAEWLDSLDVATMKKIRKFFETMPKVVSTIKYMNSFNEEREIILEGLKDFFSFA